MGGWEEGFPALQWELGGTREKIAHCMIYWYYTNSTKYEEGTTRNLKL